MNAMRSTQICSSSGAETIRCLFYARVGSPMLQLYDSFEVAATVVCVVLSPSSRRAEARKKDHLYVYLAGTLCTGPCMLDVVLDWGPKSCHAA